METRARTGEGPQNHANPVNPGSSVNPVSPASRGTSLAGNPASEGDLTAAETRAVTASRGEITANLGETTAVNGSRETLNTVTLAPRPETTILSGL